MWKDPIVEEIRTIRLEIEAECDHNFDKIFARAIETQKKLQEKNLTEDEILKDFEIFRENLRQGNAAT